MNQPSDDYEVPLNVTLLGERVGYPIDSLDRLEAALEEVAKFTSRVSVQGRVALTVSVCLELKGERSRLRIREIQSLVNELSLPALFTLLAASGHQQTLTDSVYTICRNYLSTLTTVELLRPELHRYFLAGLESTQPAAVILALDQLSRLDFSEPAQVDVCIAAAVVGRLEDESVKVSQAAAQVIKKIFVNPACLEALLAAPQTTLKLQSILASPKLKLRGVQLIFESLAPTSLDAPHCDLLKGANLLAPIFSLHPADPLLRLSLLETFGQHLQSPVPRSLIEEFRVVDAVSRDLSQSSDVAVLRGELKFLAEAYLSGFEIPRLHAFLEACLTSESPDLQGVALQVVTRIFEAPAGAKPMRAHTSFLRAVTQLCAGAGQAKVDAIACVATLFGASRSVPCEDAELTEVAQLAYDLLGESMAMPQSLVTLAQNPALEVKGPAYALLLHLAYHPFGVKTILNSPPTVDFLLDRAADATSLGQKWKYGVIETLGRQVTLMKAMPGYERLCAPELERRLSKYVQDGVVYNQLTPSVALEL
ncbi:hypothetical protein L0F63_006350 [Massospora cicadina]|nr:hypothetical protein L0F63_006350 [Massospora cicadina]